MLEQKPIYSYAGEDGFGRSSGFFAVGFLFLLGVGCFFSTKVIGVVAGSGFIALSYFLLTRVIQHVDFFENSITIHYFGRRKAVELEYSQLKLIRPFMHPRNRTTIYIAEITGRKPIRKFTWYCDSYEFETMKPLFESHKIRMHSQQ